MLQTATATLARQPSAAEIARRLSEARKMTEPFVRHLVFLEAFGSHAYLVNDDGSLGRRLEPEFPDWCIKQQAEARRLIDEVYAMHGLTSQP